jgi:hypothetical protein
MHLYFNTPKCGSFSWTFSTIHTYPFRGICRPWSILRLMLVLAERVLCLYLRGTLISTKVPKLSSTWIKEKYVQSPRANTNYIKSLKVHIPTCTKPLLYNKKFYPKHHQRRIISTCQNIPEAQHFVMEWSKSSF